MITFLVVIFAVSASTNAAPCVPTNANICVSIDTFAGESGYYNFEGYSGSSPEITVTIGDTITFDQTDATNWYHPIGFAYEPDGAHGATWGGEELPEVEGLGELLYKIDGAATTCADAGDTGLDCYEPEFFYPRSEWMTKQYTAELTITQDVADASYGGVIYYFCHIHSKMSGKIRILNTDGTAFVPTANPTELELYSTTTPSSIDNTCGTTGADKYSDGEADACSQRFLCGTLDDNFEKCLQAIDCQMNSEMSAYTSPDLYNTIAVFMQQMVPHHTNAVNMAKLLLKQAPNSVAATEDLEDILWTIINVQNYQVHQFRNFLNPLGLLLQENLLPPSQPPVAAASIISTDDDGDKGLEAGAVAGIAVGCAVAGVIIGIATMMMIGKKEAAEKNETPKSFA